MAWIRIDDHFDEHPKLVQVGPLAWGVWLAGLAYCNRNLTDGFIPWAKARRLCSFETADSQGRVYTIAVTCGMGGQDVDMPWVIDVLVEAGLWEVVGQDQRIDGYRVHDYGQYQPTKEDVLAERAKVAARVAKWKEKQAGTGNAVSNTVGNAVINAAPNPKPNPNPKVTDTDKESSPSGEPKKKVASRGARIPDGWQPNDAHRAIAKERGVDLATECVKMRDWAAANGATKKDWDATFRNWLRNAKPEVRPAARVNEMPQSAGPRDGQLRHPITEVDPLLEQQRLEQTRVDAWAKANVERAELLWAEVQDEAVAKGVTRGGEKLARGYMESRFRRRVVDEILTPKLARA